MPERQNHKGRTFGRRALLGATAVAAAGSTALTTRTAQARPNDPTTFVLVHGANGNAASFAALTAGLAAAGHRVLPVDLPGHGPQGNFPLSYQAPQDLDAFATAPPRYWPTSPWPTTSGMSRNWCAASRGTAQ